MGSVAGVVEDVPQDGDDGDGGEDRPEDGAVHEDQSDTEQRFLLRWAFWGAAGTCR